MKPPPASQLTPTNLCFQARACALTYFERVVHDRASAVIDMLQRLRAIAVASPLPWTRGASTQRVARLIARTGALSRRDADRAIVEGRVRVDPPSGI